jgi:hypothetical protein
MTENDEPVTITCTESGRKATEEEAERRGLGLLVGRCRRTPPVLPGVRGVGSLGPGSRNPAPQLTSPSRTRPTITSPTPVHWIGVGRSWNRTTPATIGITA